MTNEEIIQLVRDTSNDLMNTGKGDGTIANCYDDDEIIKEFGGKTKASIIRKVQKMDGLTAELHNDVLGWSGEYDFPEDGQPVLKYDKGDFMEPKRNDGCGWLVERPWTDEDVQIKDEHGNVVDIYYPEGPNVSECGAPVTDTENGWYCEVGHRYDNRDSQPGGLWWELEQEGLM